MIDLRTLAPFDEEMIYRSVRKTNRVVVAHEDSLTVALAGRLSPALLRMFWTPGRPVVRVAAKDTFVPSAPSLELLALPSVEDLRAGVEKVLRY